MRIHHFHSSKWPIEVHLFSLSRWENWGSRCEGIHPRPHTQLVNEKVWNPVQVNLTSTFPPHTHTHTSYFPSKCPPFPSKEIPQGKKRVNTLPWSPHKSLRPEDTEPGSHILSGAFIPGLEENEQLACDVHGLQRACSHLTVVTSRTSLQGDSALTAPI